MLKPLLYAEATHCALQLRGPSMVVQTRVGHSGQAAGKQLDLQLSPKR